MGDARGVGLIGALELADKRTKAPLAVASSTAGSTGSAAAHCAKRALEHGLVVRNIGETLALCPPLIVDDAQVDELFSKLERALDDTLEAVNGG